MFVGIDDAGFIAVAPEVSCPSHGAVVSDSDSGVEVLHSPVQVFFGSGGDDVVMVGHEDDMVEEEVIFRDGFIQCFKHDADDLSLIKAEGSVIGSADQVVRQFCLDDTQRTSHALR